MAVFPGVGELQKYKEVIRNMSDVDTRPIDKGAGGHNPQKPIRVAQIVGKWLAVVLRR